MYFRFMYFRFSIFFRFHAQQLDPTHRSSLFNLALLLRNELQDADEAIPLLKTLIEVRRKNDEIQNLVSMLLNK